MAFTDALAQQFYCCIHRLATDQYLCRVALHKYYSYYVLQQAAHKNLGISWLLSRLNSHATISVLTHTPLWNVSLWAQTRQSLLRSKNSVATMK